MRFKVGDEVVCKLMEFRGIAKIQSIGENGYILEYPNEGTSAYYTDEDIIEVTPLYKALK